jgi:hypothetical protein
MYTGDLLELVLEIVERVGGVVFAGPATTLSSKQSLRNQKGPNRQSATGPVNHSHQAQETGLHR